MSEFIEGLSPDALKNLQSFNAELEQVIGNADIAINKLSKVKTPSQSDSAAKELKAQLDAQEKAIAKLQERLVQLAATRKASNAQSAQEVVNNGILNRQAKEAATINSTLAGAYQRLSAAQSKSARVVQDIIARGIRAGQTQKQYNRELQNAQREFDKLNQKVLQADRAVGKFNRNVGNYPQMISGFKDLLGAFGIIGGVTAIAAVSRSIFETTRELQSLDLALTQVIGSSEDAAIAQEFLGRISDAYGVKIQVLTKSYTGFWAAAKNAMDSGIITGDQVNRIFESVAKAAGAMGLSVEQQQGAFLALQQMISKGNIQAEELRGQLSERLPGAFGIMAKSMGVTEAKLNDLLKQGKVMAADVLPAFARELEKAYGVENLERVESLNASVTRLSNTWTEFVRSLNEGGGTFSQVLSGLIGSLDKILQGYTFLFTSEEKNRERQLKEIRGAAYKERIEELRDLSDEEIAIMQGITREQANEVQIQLAQIRTRNAELAKSGRKTPFGSILSKASEDEITANNAKIRVLNNTLSVYSGRLEASTELLKKDTSARKAATEMTDKERQALEKLREQMALDRAAREISDLQRKKKLTEDRFEDDLLYADQKIELSNRIAALDYDIAMKQFLEQMRLYKGNLHRQAIAANDFRTSQEDAEKRNQDRITDIQNGAIDDRREYMEKFSGEGVKLDLPSNEDFWEDQEQKVRDFNQALKDLRSEMNGYMQDFSRGFLDDAGFSGLFKILNNEIAGFGKNFKKEFEEIESQKAKGLITQEEYTEKIRELNQLQTQSYLTTAVAISEVIQEMVNFISQAQQAQFDDQYRRLEQQKDIAILFAGESATAREEIDRQYEEKRKAIQRKQAEAQKRLALFNIAVGTAQGIVSALAMFPPNIPLSIAIGAIGLAQIAVVASQPIPQFAVGTENAPQGWAMVDERGPEIHTDKSGNIKSLGENKANYRYLEKGDKIIRADKSREMLMFNRDLNGILANNGINAPTVQINGGIDKEDLREVMRETIGNQPKGDSLMMSYDERGVGIYRTENGNRRQLMNGRLRIEPNNV